VLKANKHVFEKAFQFAKLGRWRVEPQRVNIAFFSQDIKQSTSAVSEPPLILNLHEVCLVLAETNLTDLGVYEDMDDSAVFADMLK